MPLARATTAVLILFAVGLAAIASAATHGRGHGHGNAKKHGHAKRHHKAKPRQARASGIYEACSYSAPKTSRPLSNCNDRLAAMRQGGFRVVLNYWTAGMSVRENLQYANRAAALGMRVIWNLSDYAVPPASKLELVRATASHRATWGYYVGDEVNPAHRADVTDLSRAVGSITRKPLLQVSRPKPSLLKPFARVADYVGPDAYPYGRRDPGVCQTSRWSTKVGRNPVMVLQAYSWSIDYPELAPHWPTARQMRRMRDRAIRCGNPELILWFCFHCVTDYHPRPGSYWRQLAWAANGVKPRPNKRMSVSPTG
jgi:hypothetical protein